MPRRKRRPRLAEIVPGRIRQYREVLDYSRRYSAALAGIAQPEWSRFESGERLPSLDRLEKIAEVLGREPWELLKP